MIVSAGAWACCTNRSYDDSHSPGGSGGTPGGSGGTGGATGGSGGALGGTGGTGGSGLICVEPADPQLPTVTPSQPVKDYAFLLWGGVLSVLESSCSPAEKQSLVTGFLISFLTQFRDSTEQNVQHRLNGGRLAIDGTKLASCRASWEPLLVGTTPQTIPDYPVGCDPFATTFLIPLQSGGMPCAESLECKTGLSCKGYTHTSLGSCVASPGIGQACGPTTPLGDNSSGTEDRSYEVGDCAVGARCTVDFNSCKNVCAAGSPPLGKLGESCAKDNECRYGLTCVNAKCAQDDVAIGGACDSNDDCDSNGYCSQQKCMADKQVGAACNSAKECSSGACENSLCVAHCGDV